MAKKHALQLREHWSNQRRTPYTVIGHLDLTGTGAINEELLNKHS